MSIYKAKRTPFYQYDFTIGGNRFRGSTETADRSTAKTVEAKLRKDAVLNNHLRRKPRMTLDVALERHWQDHGQFCRSGWSAMDGYAQNLLSHFRPGIYLDELDDAAISGYKGAQIGSMSRNKKPVSNATINRRLSFLRGVMNMARNEWGVEVADTNIGKYKLKEPQARTRWITAEQADKLIMAAAPHLKAPIRCALLTGLRLDNIIGMQWEEVNLQAGIITQKVKSSLPGRKTHETHISDTLFKLLAEQGPQKAGHVFLRRFKPDKKTGIARAPEPVRKFRRSFGTACAKAGITDFRFHDLRHTAATWMLNNGVPLDVIQKVLGHEDIQTTMKYAHRSNADQVAALDTLAKSYGRYTPDSGKVKGSAND